MYPKLALALALVGCSTSALAVPMEFSHQGRLLDSSGTPLSGPEDVTFRLYDAPSSGTLLWEEVHPAVDFQQGYFSQTLGQVTALDSSTFNGDTLYLSIQVGSSSELPDRISLISVPYAVRASAADEATNLTAGASIDAGELRINGAVVIDSTGSISGASLPGGDGDTLADLACDSDETLAFDGNAWICGPSNAHTHSASHINDGVFDIERLPVGDGPTEVAGGDHTHSYDFSDIGGSVGFVQLPVGGGSSEVAAGDHTHPGQWTESGSDLSYGAGSVVVGSSNANAELTVEGAIGLGLGADSTCDDSREGVIRYNAAKKMVEVCNGDGWATVGGGTGIYRTCAELLSNEPATPSGVYEIDLDGIGPEPVFDAYCDMSTDGGGWTLLAFSSNSASTSAKDISRNGDWETYTETGYGSPSVTAGNMYWMPLRHWNTLTTIFADNVWRIDHGTASQEMRMNDLKIGDAAAEYVLQYSDRVSGFPEILGGESAGAPKGQRFTTWDNDNDTWSGNCANDNVGRNGGFWYTNCWQNSMVHADRTVRSWWVNGDPSNPAVSFNGLWFREN